MEKSKQAVEKIIKYKLYDSLKPEQKDKGFYVLQKVLSKSNEAERFFPEKCLDAWNSIKSYENWALFYAEVHSLRNRTQPEGEDDYCILYPQTCLFIAHELFFLPPELVSELIFREHSNGKLSPLEIKALFPENYVPTKVPLDTYIEDLLKKRTVDYHLKRLIEVFLDCEAERSYYKGKCYAPPENRVKHHIDSINREVKKLIKKNPKNLETFINYLKQSYASLEGIERQLGNLHVWSALYRRLIKDMRISIAEADLKRLANIVPDAGLINKSFITPYESSSLDSYIVEESKKATQETRQFLTGLKTDINEQEQEFYKSLKKFQETKDNEALKNARNFLELLQEMANSFPNVLEGDTAKILQDLKFKIKTMRRAYENQNNNP